MAVTPKKSPVKSVALRLSEESGDFRILKVIDAFSIEKTPSGCMLRVSYGQGKDSEVVVILISNEGIAQFVSSSADYLKTFSDVVPFDERRLSAGRQLAPVFANHIRLALSGEIGEAAFSIVPMFEIAKAAQGHAPSGHLVRAIPVALFHSDSNTHKQLALALFNFQ